MEDPLGQDGIMAVLGTLAILALAGLVTIGIGGIAIALPEVPSQSIEINNPFEKEIERWRWRKIQREAAVIAAISKELSDIAGKYGNLECDKAAEDMKRYLKRKKKHGAIIKLTFPGAYRGYVVSATNPNEAISRTGMHMGILYEGMVYCNVYPMGLPEDVWINSFYDALGGSPIVTKYPF